MSFNPYKDLIIQRQTHEYRKPVEVEEFKFPEFNLRKILNPELLPIRQVEYNGVHTTATVPPRAPGESAPDPSRPHAVSTSASHSSGADAAITSARGPQTSQGTNLVGGGPGRMDVPVENTRVVDDSLPGGEGSATAPVTFPCGSFHSPWGEACAVIFLGTGN